MTFFIRNILMLHILALAAALSWIHGSTRPELLMPVIPWLTVAVLDLLLVFPQARRSETLAEARQRVWGGLLRDPLLYILILLVIYLCAPFFNVSGMPEYNPVEKIWRNPRPPYPALPFCVEPYEHAVMLLWFIPVLISALAARHGLLKSGKRMLVEVICWNGALVSIFGFLQLLTGATSVYWGEAEFSYFFATFGYPNFAGAFFTLLFALSTGVWMSKATVGVLGPMQNMPPMDAPSFIRKHYMALITLLNLAGAIGSLSRAAIFLSALVSLVLGLYLLVGLWQKSGQGQRLSISVVGVAILMMAGGYFTVFAPKALKTEIADITPQTVMERVSAHGQYHYAVAKKIYHDHPWFGVGGWGYPHYQLSYLKPGEHQRMQITGGANVHNDMLQFLAELGRVGVWLLTGGALVLIISLFWQGFRVHRGLLKVESLKVSAKPRWLYLLSPMIIAIVVGTTATVGHSLGDLPFRCPAVVIVWLLAWACAPGFLPVVRVK